MEGKKLSEEQKVPSAGLPDFASIDCEIKPQLDTAMAFQHLELLGKNEDHSWLGAYKPKNSKKHLHPWTGPFSELETAQRMNQEGRGLYLGINNGDGLKDVDIYECVAVWSEDDDRSKEDQLKRAGELMPDPTFAVETSKSHHLYWVLNQPIAPEVWRPIQSQVVDHLDGDRAVKSLSRVLRLAGSWYVNSDNELTRLVRLHSVSGNRYSVDKLLRYLPDPKPVQRRIPRPLRKNRLDSGSASTTLREIVGALKCIPPRVPGTNTYAEYRNLLWGLKAALKEADAGYDIDVAIQLMEAHSPDGWDIQQVAESGGDQIGAGTFWFYANQYGWRRDEQR